MGWIVTPFVGVWIEICSPCSAGAASAVTPFVGVWIEIAECPLPERQCAVTPFVGVWIEISVERLRNMESMSLPSWECGLKLPCLDHCAGAVR